VPGIYLQVAFTLQPRSAVQVPASAMIFRGSGPEVAVITDGDAVKFQGVSIARDNGKFVEIASGLSEGDRVAVNISNQITDGEKVSVREMADEASPATK
jgi:membrane fusion protein (multidrug efflux system)